MTLFTVLKALDMQVTAHQFKSAEYFKKMISLRAG